MISPGSGLRSIEVASGLVFGTEPAGEPVAAVPPIEIRGLLEDSVRPALARPPCLVSFSGGRDSSCVLALAASVARREGLPLPIPATLRFPGLPESDENDWQERVVRHLGLDDWIRVEAGDDLDVIGSVAKAVLAEHGLLWPFNSYVHRPLAEQARGGSLLTGVGGDEIFELMTPHRMHALLARRARPVPRDVLRVGLGLAPGRIRRSALRRRSLQLPWLTTAGQAALRRAWGEDEAHVPRRLSARAAWWPRRRGLRVALRSLSAVAGEDVLLVNPLASPALAASLLADPELAFADRAGRLRSVFGELLFDALYERRSKASFNRAFFGSESRAFVQGWEGGGVDTGLVDPSALRRAWREPVPDGRTFTLLQHAWLLTRFARAGASPLPRATTTSEGDAAPSRAEPPA